MNKTLIISVSILAVIVAVYFVIFQQQHVTKISTTNESVSNQTIPVFENKTVLDRVNGYHLAMDPNDLGELEALIKGNEPTSTRERAIFVYSDIAARTNNNERALDFLKEMAYNESDDDLRTAAYANYYFVKEQMDIPPSAEMNVTLNGTVRKGSNITVNLEIYPNVDIPEAYAMIKRESYANYSEMANDSKQLSLNASQPITVSFPVELTEDGKHIIKARLKLTFDRLDYEVIEKNIFLDVTEGKYEIG